MVRAIPTRKVVSDNLSHAHLWEAFWSGAAHSRDALMEAYLPLTRRVLERISIRLPAHVALEDLSQAALLGLYKAMVDFQPHRRVPFEAYAYPRIRGSILDELRANDFLSRSRRSQMERVEAVIAQWLREHGQMPRDEDICDALEMTPETLSQLIDQSKPWCSLDATDENDLLLHEVIADPNSVSEEQAQVHDVRHILRNLFRQLDMREQKILYLYYFEELRLSEIAALYGISEARVSQIRTMSIMRLRAAMLSMQGEDVTLHQ
jgi:RNA polymerase sigma factor FliA